VLVAASALKAFRGRRGVAKHRKRRLEDSREDAGKARCKGKYIRKRTYEKNRSISLDKIGKRVAEKRSQNGGVKQGKEKKTVLCKGPKF